MKALKAHTFTPTTKFPAGDPAGIFHVFMCSDTAHFRMGGGREMIMALKLWSVLSATDGDALEFHEYRASSSSSATATFARLVRRAAL
ncbi:hypothetical protein CN934_03670 [Ensifer sp. MMN_5]|nr:hypothetical protein CN934_03670 [Ensifer sp. MMN_5]